LTEPHSPAVIYVVWIQDAKKFDDDGLLRDVVVPKSLYEGTPEQLAGWSALVSPYSILVTRHPPWHAALAFSRILQAYLQEKNNTALV
jgi:hypothetical protein